ncbi:MAG TPA: hypothetical protein VMI72_17830 [Roseiarcus sp.]|nr:hypothetical protein [Roseiarcus sp.]
MRTILSLLFALFFPTQAFSLERVGLSFTCTTTLLTIHQDNDQKPSFQLKPNERDATFVVDVTSAKEPDPLACDDSKKQSLYIAAYCKFPYQATIESKSGQETLYSDDGDNFRSAFPWKYFAFFADGHFLSSSTISDGVVIQTGACLLK